MAGPCAPVRRRWACAAAAPLAAPSPARCGPRAGPWGRRPPARHISSCSAALARSAASGRERARAARRRVRRDQRASAGGGRSRAGQACCKSRAAGAAERRSQARPMRTTRPHASMTCRGGEAPAAFALVGGLLTSIPLAAAATGLGTVKRARSGPLTRPGPGPQARVSSSGPPATLGHALGLAGAARAR
jgi:hypothetical protein